ncbi:MAG TPA: response regulator transcription factor [Vicinamibacteria bacterium]
MTAVRPRVLLADDHTIVTEGLKSILDPEFELVGTAEDGRALLAAAEKLQPDVIVADITMPRLNGLDAVRALKKRNHRSKVVFLTMHSDPDLATEAFRVGASGYLLKQSAGEELITAIHTVLQGEVYVTPELKQEVLEAFMRAGSDPDRTSVKVTARQREVLQLVAEGHTMKKIASALNVSTRTVESHKYDVMEKLGIETTAELIQYAIRRGIVSL